MPKPLNKKSAAHRMIPLLTVLIFLATGGSGVCETLEAKPLSPVTLQLRWFHQFQFAGYYAALEKGYYREAGLDVTIVEGGYHRPTVDQVVSGRAQYGVTNAEVLLHRLSGKPLVVLAAVFQHSPLVLISRKATGVDHPQQLIGKRVKMTRQSRDIELHAVFLNEGIDLTDIAIVEGGARIDDYFDPTIQAAAAYVTNEPFYLKQRHIPYTIIHPRTYGVDFYGDCLFTTEQEIASHPDRVRAFREASLRGWTYAMDHPEEIIDRILADYPTRKSRAHLRYEAAEMQKLILPDLVQIGHINPGRWRHIAETFQRAGLITPPYSMDGFLYDPDPGMDTSWVFWVMGVSLITILVVGGTTVALFRFNRRLQREVLERQQSEAALKASEEKYRLLFESAEIMVSVYDRDGVCLMMNRQVAALFGGVPEDFIGRSFAELHPERAERYTSRIRSTIDSGRPESYEDEVAFPAGSRCLLSTTHPVRDADGRIFAAQIISQDITDRMQTQEDLRESEATLRAIFEASPDPMVVYDTVGHPQYINPAFTQVFGWTLADLKGKRIPFVPDDQVAVTQKSIREIYESGGPVTFESKRYTRDGRMLSFLVSAALIRDAAGHTTGMVVNLTDVTERKELETRFQAAQRMEALATLAGGIAHDFNNLLMGIQGRVSLMLADGAPGADQAAHLQTIEEHVASASDLTRQLLGLARGGKYEVKISDINRIVEKQIRMFGRTRKEIAIHARYDHRIRNVAVDRGQIQQVLLNLFVNAWQAMPEGGDLYVRTDNVVLDADAAALHGVTPGVYASIAVRDTGTGMDEAILQRIFDPFFTTKEIGRGTGLGLASAYGIIHNHGGYIAASSEPGKGSTFTLFLPATEKPTTEERRAPASIEKGSGTVLLVDDEELIVSVGREMLQRLGYDVMVCRSGREAVDRFAENRRRIDLVILDMIMPGWDGGQTFDRLRAIDGNVRVILSSGYTLNGRATEILERGCNGFIQKPFDLKTLSRKIAEVMEMGGN